MVNRMIHTPSYLPVAAPGGGSAYWDQTNAAIDASGWYYRQATANSFQKSFAEQTGWTVGFLFKYGAGTNTAWIVLQLLAASTLQVDLRFNQTSGCFFVTRNGTTLLTSTTALAANTEYYVEIQFVIADSGGVAILKVDGVTDSVINSSSLDTRNGTPTTVDTLLFMGTNAIGPAIKDIYVNDNSGGVDDTFWGPITVGTLRVSGNGATNSWTPLSSTNASNVDDTAYDDDTTYNSTTTNGHVDTFVMTDTGYASGTVKGVEYAAEVRRTEPSGTARVAPVMRPASTDRVGTDAVLRTTYRFITQQYRLNPETASAWTVAALDGMQAGIKRTAA